MKKLFFSAVLIAFSISTYADVIDELDRKIPNREYQCTFPESFLIGVCKGNQYFYVEELSSVKKADLAEFYRFVRKSGNEHISDICTDFKNKKFIKCNDLGIVLEAYR